MRIILKPVGMLVVLTTIAILAALAAVNLRRGPEGGGLHRLGEGAETLQEPGFDGGNAPNSGPWFAVRFGGAIVSGKSSGGHGRFVRLEGSETNKTSGWNAIEQNVALDPKHSYTLDSPRSGQHPLYVMPAGSARRKTRPEICNFNPQRSGRRSRQPFAPAKSAFRCISAATAWRASPGGWKRTMFP